MPSSPSWLFLQCQVQPTLYFLSQAQPTVYFQQHHVQANRLSIPSNTKFSQMLILAMPSSAKLLFLWCQVQPAVYQYQVQSNAYFGNAKFSQLVINTKFTQMLILAMPSSANYLFLQCQVQPTCYFCSAKFSQMPIFVMPSSANWLFLQYKMQKINVLLIQ